MPAFATFTEDLERLADWLLHCGATTVALEILGSQDSTRCGLPRNRSGSAPASLLSGPAQRSLTLWLAILLSRSAKEPHTRHK